MTQASGVVLAHIDAEIAGAVGALVVSLVIVLIVWAVRGSHGGAIKGTVVRPGGPSCACGLHAKWMMPNGGWHCDRCNAPVPQATAMPMPMQQQGPFCGTCGGPGRWLAEQHAWGCDRCRMLIQPPAR